jgi:hypothetical protein
MNISGMPSTKVLLAPRASGKPDRKKTVQYANMQLGYLFTGGQTSASAVHSASLPVFFVGVTL